MLEAGKVGLHIWLSILIVGTLWRLLSYHAMASGNAHVNHIGQAMSLQY